MAGPDWPGFLSETVRMAVTFSGSKEMAIPVVSVRTTVPSTRNRDCGWPERMPPKSREMFMITPVPTGYVCPVSKKTPPAEMLVVASSWSE